MSGGGGGGDTTTTQRTEIPDELKPFAEKQVAGALQLFGDTGFNEFNPQFFPGQLTAGFNPLEQQAQSGAANFLQSQGLSNLNQLGGQAAAGLFNPFAQNTGEQLIGQGQNFLGQSADFSNFGFNPNLQAAQQNLNPAFQQALSGNALNNPAIQGSIDAFTNSSIKNLNENILPGIRSNIISAGGPSTRGDLVQGQAAGQVGSDVARFAAGLQQNAQNQAFGQQNLALQLGAGAQSDFARQLEAARAARSGEFARLGAGELGFGFQGLQQGFGQTQAGLGALSQFPSSILGQFGALGGIGSQQRQLEQQFINDDIRQFEFGQNQDLLRLQALSGSLQGNPLLGAGSSFGTSTAPSLSGVGSAISGGLGGALSGAAIGTQFGGPGIGTAIGGGLGLLSGFF